MGVSPPVVNVGPLVFGPVKLRKLLQTQEQSMSEDGKGKRPAMIEAVTAYASVGELTGCLVEAYGRYEEPVQFS